MYFSGYANKEIHGKLGIGSGSISNIYNEFVGESISMGIEEAAEKFGVKELLNELHEVSIDLRAAKVNAAGAKEGAELVKKLKEMGVELLDLDNFIKKLVKKAEDYDLAVIVQSAQKLYDLEKMHGKSYTGIVKNFEERSEDLKQLNDRIKKLKVEEREAEESREAALRRAKITEQVLEEYKKMKDSLLKHGLRLQDIETISIAFENIRAHDKEYRKIIKAVMEVEKLSQKLQDLREQFARKTQELDALKLNLEEDRKMHKETEELKMQGLTLQNMKKLNAIAKNFKSPEEFLEDLNKAYQLYGGVLGLQGQIAKLEGERGIAEAGLKKVLAENNVALATVETVNRLREKDVTSREIEELDRIVQKFGPSILNDILDKGLEHSRLVTNVTELSKKEAKIELSIAALQGKLEGEQNVISKLDSEVKDLRTEREKIEKARDTLLKEVEDLTQTKEGLEQALAKISELENKIGLVGSFNVLRKLMDSPATIEAEPKTILSVIASVVQALLTYLKGRGATVPNSQSMLETLGKLNQELTLVIGR